ncbi:MAG: hypothetical protein ABIA63_05395 [bacterium]
MARWYDKHKRLAVFFNKLKEIHPKTRDKISKKILTLIRESENPNLIFNKAFDFPLDDHNKRWYDNEPYIWLIINGLQYADKKLLKSVTVYLGKELADR